ncbi:MAG: cation:proton antiporter domain-containing protein, partial [Usitatibacter sp.]
MHDALTVALILLASAVAVVALFRQLGMPAILGYLLVGAAIGPHALSLVPATESQRYLAEFGVVFLMFSVGLEFSLPQLNNMRRVVFGFGGLQVASIVAIGAGGSFAAGLTLREGIVVGGVLAMSSTAIVSKMLSERMQLQSAYGRQVMGVLLFQDLAVIPLVVLIPALALTRGEIA